MATKGNDLAFWNNCSLFFLIKLVYTHFIIMKTLVNIFKIKIWMLQLLTLSDRQIHEDSVWENLEFLGIYGSDKPSARWTKRHYFYVSSLQVMGNRFCLFCRCGSSFGLIFWSCIFQLNETFNLFTFCKCLINLIIPRLESPTNFIVYTILCST